MYFIGVTEGKKKNWKKEGKMKISILFSFTQYILPTWRFTQNLKTLAPIRAEKSVTEIFIWEKKKEQIKGLISNMWLFFCYTVQLI